MPTKQYTFEKFIVLLHRKVSKLVSNLQTKFIFEMLNVEC